VLSVEFVLVLHFAVTWFLVGLIWIVQLVHYPLMCFVSANKFAEFEAAHCSRISWIVAPAMALEVLSGLWCAVLLGYNSIFLVSLALLVVVWASTAFIQVPLHNKLSNGLNERCIERLVRTNWLRTIAWTGRGCLVAQVVLTGILVA
jgi:hypothetical protein